jgi:hypothetical protein
VNAHSLQDDRYPSSQPQPYAAATRNHHQSIEQGERILGQAAPLPLPQLYGQGNDEHYQSGSANSYLEGS